MFKSIFGLFGKTAPADEMVGDWLLDDRFQAFLAEPTPANYLKLRRLVLDDKAYRASSSGFVDVQLLIDHGRLIDARARLRAMNPARLLSPRVHQLAAEVAHSLNDRDDERKELLIYERCVEGILCTGDGSRACPYLITHAGDEYDLIDHLDRRIANQSLLREESRSLEHVECQDGTDLWFDLTELHERLDAPPKLSKPRRPNRSRR